MSMLSIRDVFRVMWLPYERLDNRNLVFEHSRHMVRQKFHQTINVMFDVHGAAGSDIAGRLKLANDAVRDAERAAQALRAMVEEEHPLGALVLETNRDNARRDVAALAAQQPWSTATTSRAWSIAWARCGGQFADDKKKLTFLKEAEQLFDPLHVTVCPACLSTLDFPPVLVDGACTLCGHEVEPEGDSVAEQQEDARRQRGKAPAGAGSAAVLQAELKATTRRLDELNEYWTRRGAQLVVVDNSPPEIVADDVVKRFTRDRTKPPYGLIDDATD